MGTTFTIHPSVDGDVYMWNGTSFASAIDLRRGQERAAAGEPLAPGATLFVEVQGWERQVRVIRTDTLAGSPLVEVAFLPADVSTCGVSDWFRRSDLTIFTWS